MRALAIGTSEWCMILTSFRSQNWAPRLNSAGRDRPTRSSKQLKFWPVLRDGKYRRAPCRSMKGANIWITEGSALVNVARLTSDRY
jgi:hypothetical protein